MNKIRIKPPIGKSQLIAGMIDRLFHDGSGVDKRIYMVSHRAESVIKKHSCAAGLDDLCFHRFPIQPSKFFRQLFEVEIQIFFRKNCVSRHPAPHFLQCYAEEIPGSLFEGFPQDSDRPFPMRISARCRRDKVFC